MRCLPFLLPAALRRARRVKHNRFPGICEDAVELGVHRVHLYMVLAGKRSSDVLLARYRALKRRDA